MLLGLPHDWLVTPMVDGAAIDTPIGRMTHVARAPLARARDLAMARLAWRPDYRFGALDRAITDEGEHAVIATATATDREIVWGFVYADDSVAMYELEAPLGRARDSITTAVRAHRFALGLRWRRYHYRVPAGWDALARGAVTDWLAPHFPRSWAVLTVYPAFPASSLTIGIVPSLLANAKAQGLVIARESPFEPANANGLEGVGVEVAGTFGSTQVQVAIAAFLDDRYVYAMELQSRSPAAWVGQRGVLADTLGSVEPVPRGRHQIELGEE